MIQKRDLDAYDLLGDPVLRLLREAEQPGDAPMSSQRWLLDSLPKRMLYWRLYGDLLSECEGLSILDVGGGYSSLTRVLADRHDYTVLDIFAHDDHTRVAALDAELGGVVVFGDWFRVPPERIFDVVVANDLFPNVDQRLELFLELHIPRCRELRLSLTFHNTPRFYETRRVDGDETLFVLAWDGDQLARALARACPALDGPLDDLPEAVESLFANGRQICIATLLGDVR